MSRKYMFILGLCGLCCAAPLFFLISGGAGLGLIFSGSYVEFIVCMLAALALLGLYVQRKRRRPQKICCGNPNTSCTSHFCSTEKSER